MDISISPVHSSERSSNNAENTIKSESNETIMTFGEDGLHYSDFENVEYEEVDGEFISSRQTDEYTNLNSLKSSRKRTRNFSQNECRLLCTLLEHHSDILELRKNDQKTNHLKTKAWIEITQKFNHNTNDEYRTASQLKTFYENLKKKRKKLYKGENGEPTDLSFNNTEGKSQSESVYHSAREPAKISDTIRRHNSFLDDYQRKKIELVNKEIARVESACDQQRKLFLLQEEKLMLEIEEIKDRLKNK